jgi:hypothetical protein
MPLLAQEETDLPFQDVERLFELSVEMGKCATNRRQHAFEHRQILRSVVRSELEGYLAASGNRLPPCAGREE